MEQHYSNSHKAPAEIKSESMKQNKPTDVEIRDASDNSDIAVGHIIYSVDQEAKLLRKIDLRLMPLMLVAYMLQFLDKVTLGNAAIMGIQKDLHLIGNEYSWASSIFYFWYLFASLPGSYGLVKLPLSRYLTSTIIIWAIIVALHSVTHNFAGIMVLRFFLGSFESIITPGFSMITSVCVSSIFGGVLAYAIAHITVIPPWKILFIVYGGATLVWGVVMLILLPDSPQAAKLLDASERDIAMSRLTAGKTSVAYRYQMSQVKEALMDPKTYLFSAYSFLSCMANGALTNFGSIVIEGFGFSTFNTFLLQIPNSVVVVGLVIVSTRFADKVPGSRCSLVISFILISLVGAIMVRYINVNHKVARLVGQYIISWISCAFPLMLSMIASNVTGCTKKTFTNALFLVAYCVGNIAGPRVFIAKEAPNYPTAFNTMIACAVLNIVVVGALPPIMILENRRRDRRYGSVGGPSTTHTSTEDLDDTNDLTDWQQERSFRYLY